MTKRWLRQDVRRVIRLALRRPERAAEEMDEELRSHIESRIDWLVARGMSRDDAEAEARRRFGTDFAEAQQTLREAAERREHLMKKREWWEDLVSDSRYAARGLARRPGFTFVAVTTLALGIGGATAMYGTVHALLLRPLPFRKPQQLVAISLSAAPEGPGDLLWSYAKFALFRDGQREYRNLALYSRRQFTITSQEPERTVGELVDAQYLPTLGVVTAHGRNFDASETAHAGSRRLVILGYALWQRRYGANPDVVGTTIEIDRTTFEIVGVAPTGFRGLSGDSELFLPLTAIASAEELNEPYSHSYNLVGRLQPEVTVPAAGASALALGERIRSIYPRGRGFRDSPAERVTIVLLDATRVTPVVRRSVLVLQSAVGFLLLIVCANLAGLLLGRAAMRNREMAIRISLGAGRSRLVRLLLTESLLIALCGGAVALLVAMWATQVMSGLNPLTALRAQGIAGLGAVGFSSIRLDGATLIFAGLITLLAAVACGLTPALAATRSDVSEGLKGRTTSDATRTLGRTNWRVLVVAEMSLATMLLVGSGLMVRSLVKLMAVDPGFRGRDVLTLRLSLPPGQVRDSLPVFYDGFLERLGALPGVASVALADCPPLSGGCSGSDLERVDGVSGAPTPIGIHWVSPQWFATLGVPLKQGRLFDATDRLGAQAVVIISEGAAKAAFPNEDPIGKRVNAGQGGFRDGAIVVGVVGDVRFGAIDSPPGSDVYLSYLQSPRSGMMIFVRTALDAGAMTASVRQVVREMLPQVPLYDVQRMEARTARATAQTRYSATLLAVFSGVAFVLALLGVYGVVSFDVTRRTRELGIRIALGADRRRIVELVLRQGATLTVIGVAIGLVAAIGATRVLRELLFGITATDLPTYAVIVGALSLAGLAASWVPARRAGRVEPMVSLRAD